MLNADSVIFLLGAGASKDAGIPISAMMMNNVESLLNDDWMEYKDLYHCLKSSILHGLGMNGEYEGNLINIETLVNTMDELIKRIKHPIYPFVGSWIPRLTELTNNKFDMIDTLRSKIVSQLLDRWMKFEQNENIGYYKGFLNFQMQYKSVVRIFTLNYDLCVEEACKEGKVNRGFDIVTHEWNWRNFENEEENDFNIVLYKLHGSMDWAREPSGLVKETRNGVTEKEAALIFGTTYKLQYLDPFLYLIYEFRKRTLDPKTETIICIGYSFGDEHINGIIEQSIMDNPKREIIVVSPVKEIDIPQKKIRILEKLKMKSSENIHIVPMGAKDFLENKLSIQFIESVLPKEEPPF